EEGQKSTKIWSVKVSPPVTETVHAIRYCVTFVIFGFFVFFAYTVTMTTAQSTEPDLLVRGQTLAQALRQEGRVEEAQTVAALLEAVNPVTQPAYLTTGEVARRIGVSRQTVVNWVKKGWLKGRRIGGRIIIPRGALSEFDDLLTVFDALDADRPPATDEEINAALEPERRNWTWVGKKR
ncbi:MAG TPA: helix-turn-helix domain-containing protein, partial [Anaerolineae bacterium]|nr:helix-turn-helix domain-containing protein [Anaerolineae bacterium]